MRRSKYERAKGVMGAKDITYLKYKNTKTDADINRILMEEQMKRIYPTTTAVGTEDGGSCIL